VLHGVGGSLELSRTARSTLGQERAQVVIHLAVIAAGGSPLEAVIEVTHLSAEFSL